MFKVLWLFIKRHLDPVDNDKWSILGDEKYFRLYPEADLRLQFAVFIERFKVRKSYFDEPVMFRDLYFEYLSKKIR